MKIKPSIGKSHINELQCGLQTLHSDPSPSMIKIGQRLLLEQFMLMCMTYAVQVEVIY